MKKAIKLAIVFVLLAGTASAASETSIFKVYSIGGKKINVEIQDVLGKATSYIVDSDNQVLFERKLKEKGKLNVTFDVSNLDPGSYHFVVQDQLRRRSVPFELTEEDVTVKMDEFVRTNFPQIVKNDRKVYVKLLADESNDLAIEIKKQSGETLFKETIDGKLGLIGKRFEFTSGKYLITLTSNHYSQTSYFTF